jgi:hypothetical protein
VLAAVLEIVERVPGHEGALLLGDVREAWRPRLLALRDRTLDLDERRRLGAALRDLALRGAERSIPPGTRRPSRSATLE